MSYTKPYDSCQLLLLLHACSVIVERCSYIDNDPAVICRCVLLNLFERDGVVLGRILNREIGKLGGV